MSEALLTCKHHALFDPMPEVGDVLYCRRCRDYRRCVSAIVDWRFSCRQDGCNVARRYARDETRARQVAVRHCWRFRHTVQLWEGSQLIEVFEPVGDPLPGMEGVTLL